MLEKISIHTNDRTELIEITSKVKDVIAGSNIKDGIVMVYTPHTTAGITINENADPDVVKDILMEVNKIIPFSDSYKHREGNSAAHIKSSLFGASESLVLNDGELLLGTWQGIYFCEFDGSRRRKIYIKIIEG
ncbi:MAG: secondary thiamine-phosphate synthase enzyme YjbQ [Halanaerobiales bacterium]